MNDPSICINISIKWTECYASVKTQEKAKNNTKSLTYSHGLTVRYLWILPQNRFSIQPSTLYMPEQVFNMANFFIIFFLNIPKINDKPQFYVKSHAKKKTSDRQWKKKLHLKYANTLC